MSTIAERLSEVNTKLNNILTNANTELTNKGKTAVSDLSDLPSALGELKNPTGTISITENGTVDVSQYANADVNVSSGGDYNAKFNTTPTASKNSATLNLVALPEFDFTNLTNASYFFAGLPISEILFKNTQNVQNFSFMLQNCSNLESIPAEINCASAINTGSMFYGCSKLTSIKLVNTASIITTASMFYNCSKLTSVDLGTMSGGITNASSMFYGCSKLTSIALFDTSHITGGNGSSMFYGCSSLADVPQFDFSLVTNMNNMFKNCSSLTNASLNNILASCAGATNITSSSFKTLKQIGLTSAQATICTGLSNWSALSSAGWTTGY